MGYSRDSLDWFKELYQQVRKPALRGISCEKPCIKNRDVEHIKKEKIEFVIEKPTYGQLRTSSELKKKGIFVSPGGVRSIWFHHAPEIIE